MAILYELVIAAVMLVAMPATVRGGAGFPTNTRMMEEQTTSKANDDRDDFKSEPLLAGAFNNVPGFYHGVASGDPLPDAVILWTRYTPTSVDDKIQLNVRIAKLDPDNNIPLEDHLDPQANSELRITDTITVDSSTDFSAKLDVKGLESGTKYVYAFVNSNQGTVSPVGQTQTAPATPSGSAMDVTTTDLTYVVLSCAVYTNGYFHAYDVASTIQNLDFWIHIGDYIYEYAAWSLYASSVLKRQRELRPKWETVSLQDYRQRYALYHEDEALQNLRRRAPLIAVWDDHEFADNAYGSAADAGAGNHQEICPANGTSSILEKNAAMCEFDEGSIVDRMEGAARAYMEWMPIRKAPGRMGMLSESVGSIAQVIEWGDLATFVTFDSRISHRSREPTLASVLAEFENFANVNTNVSEYTDPASSVKEELDAIAASVRAKLYDPQFTMIGDDGKNLLQDVFSKSKQAGKPWQIYGSSTLMGPNVFPIPGDLWKYAPTNDIKLKVNTTIAEWLASSSAAGTFLRSVTAMAVTMTPWNRDDFNGFASERAEILDMSQAHANNLIVVGGDLHDSYAWIMHKDGNVTGQPVAVNLAAPGVSAPGAATDLSKFLEPIDELLEGDGAFLVLQQAWEANNPGLVHAELRHRGLMAVKATREKHVAEFYHISSEDQLNDYDTARSANSGGLTSNYYCSGMAVTHSGRPGSLVKQAPPCDQILFETEKRPPEWSIPVPLAGVQVQSSSSIGKVYTVVFVCGLVATVLFAI